MSAELAHDLIRVTKRFTFEMAHALRCHDGMCAQIHGHSYVLDVTLNGTPRNEPGDPKDGMVMDFAELKKLVTKAVIEHYDHALVLHEGDRNAVVAGHELFARVRFTPWQPSCENVLLDIVARLREVIQAPVRLHRVRLQETATSWAEWEAE
ncbi:MAG: 6-carboxytetrahydropterin synthase [Flavobacteriales bacterium]|nr:6-carboxytetrahydropterin synthase [Flavobacteriales bacterium]MCC6936661.1 6-carboxytetrahydropterin synthase [Flavobacteriales bacterium]